MASVQTQISQLPSAGAITGDELVPIVQNGLTVQTTTGAISASPSQTQTFITVNQEPTLTNSRALSAGSGVTLTDGGAQAALQIGLDGAAASLNSAGTGIMAKTATDTVTARSIASGTTGLSVANGDGVSGNPTISLTGQVLSLANASGAGLVALPNNGTVTPVEIVGTTSEIVVANGTGAAGNPTIGLADDAVLPGTHSVTIPAGDTSNRPVSPTNGMLRYNTDSNRFEAYADGSWTDVGTGDGTVSSVSGTANQIAVANGTTTPVVSIVSNPVLPGSASVKIPAGATSDRPGSPSNGMIRYNTDTGLFEGYLSGAWTDFASGSGVTSVATGTGLTGGPITSTGTISIDDTVVVTVDGTQTLENKTIDSPIIKNNFKFEAAGIAAYSQFSAAIGSWVSNYNGYQEVYALNQNNGSEASMDYVLYNDASDVNSYFIDMGMNSSNYTSATYTIFTPNSGYLFTGGGLSGQASDLFIGTSNAASDVIFFTGDVLAANARGRIKGDTGNFLLGTATDTGELLQVGGTSYFDGASEFGSTVLLSADPTLALEAATKQYVDAATSSGFTVHPSVDLATTAALPANTYNNGTAGVGATLTANATGVLTVDGVATTLGQRILVKDEATAANNGVYDVTTAGAVGVAYVLTRASDFNQAASGEIANNAYFLVTAGATLKYNSYVMSQTGAITVGTTALPFTLFSTQLTYTGGTNIDVTGQVISLTGTVAATNGGTGTSTVTTGDLLYGSAANTWSKLALGTAYKSLTINSSGTQVEWNAVALNQSAAVSGQLGVANGGTGASTLTGYVKGSGTSALTASSTIPNTDITGLGTMSTQAANNVAITGGTIEGTTVGATTAATVRGTTITATTQFTGAGTGLTGTASSLSIGGNAATATSATTATNVAGGAAGSIVYQTGSGATSTLALGTQGYVLVAGASAPTWSGINGGTF